MVDDLRGTLAQPGGRPLARRPPYAVRGRDPTGARGHVRPHRAHRRTSTRRCGRSWPRPACRPRPSTATSSRRTSCSCCCSTTAGAASSARWNAGCSGSTRPRPGCGRGSRVCSPRRPTPRAAGRTRPFVTDQDRLAEAFPASNRRRSTSSSTSSPAAIVVAARPRERTRRCRGRLPHGVHDAARPPDPRHPTHRRRDRPPRALLPRTGIGGDQTRGGTT